MADQESSSRSSIEEVAAAIAAMPPTGMTIEEFMADPMAALAPVLAVYVAAKMGLPLP